MNKEIKKEQKRVENRDISQRLSDYKSTYRATGCRRAATRAYCAGNKWATENAKAVGNW